MSAEDIYAVVYEAPVEDFYWLVWTGAIVAFIMAFGIGANDAANTFGTSVGAKSLKLWQAMIICAICEVAGCLLMGKNVTDTVRKGIVKPDAFYSQPDILMIGMYSALIGASSWLIIATRYGMPVSTTHSIIGAVLGFGLSWPAATSTINVSKVVLVVISWIASPLLAGVFAAGFYALFRWAVLRRNNAFKASKIFYPIVLFAMFFIMSLFIVVKGAGRHKVIKELEIGWAILVSVGVGIVATLLIYFTVFWFCIFPRIRSLDEKEVAEKWKVAIKEGAVEELDTNDLDIDDVGADKTPQIDGGDVESPKDGKAIEEEEGKKGNCIARMWNAYIGNQGDRVHEEIDGFAAKMHANSETYPPKVELLFSGVQIATAAFDSFAHGANDTANALGPLAAVVIIYQTGTVSEKSDTPIWAILLCCAGLAVGLGLWGWRVIRQMGVKLVKVTPSRGYVMELSSAFAVIVASKLGIPVSTTHCQVGAEIGVGMVDGGKKCAKSVNWKLMAQVFLAWVVTLIFAGGVTALVFSFAVWSPGKVFEIPYTTELVPSDD